MDRETNRLIERVIASMAQPQHSTIVVIWSDKENVCRIASRDPTLQELLVRHAVRDIINMNSGIYRLSPDNDVEKLLHAGYSVFVYDEHVVNGYDSLITCTSNFTSSTVTWAKAELTLVQMILNHHARIQQNNVPKQLTGKSPFAK